MKKILGLDVGPASIGFALVIEQNGKATEIKVLNSRIIPLSADEKTEFTRGQAATKNAKRRLKRSARRNNHRYKIRRQALSNLLKKLQMLPGEELIQLPALELYFLRHVALSEKISLPKLGRILIHLNQKRGYKSLRGTNDPEESPSSETNPNKKEKKSEWQERFDSLETELKVRNMTPGQLFFENLRTDPLYRVKEKICSRERYLDEFDKIWECQKNYYPDILTPENRRQIRDEIIFYQRPLKSAKHLVSECDFESFWAKNKNGEWEEMHPKVAPKSSPLFQLCKVWESVNAISIKNRAGQDVEITFENKKVIADYLENHPKISATELLKKLNLKPREYVPNALIKEKGIQGNLTRSLLLERFEKAGLAPGAWLDLNLPTENYNNPRRPDPDSGEIIPRIRVAALVENTPYYRLWHLLYAAQDDNTLVLNLQKMLGCTVDQAKIIAAIDLKKGGYGNKSAKAIRHILPYLMQGEVYSEACKSAGYNHSNSLTREENKERQLLDFLKPIRQNSLRNPVVEKILNQLVHIVNKIIEVHGRPDEIRVELARELKQSKEERADAFKSINKREREKIGFSKQLEEEPEFRALGRTRVSARNLEKYRLWLEFNKQSPYEINKTIGLAELFRDYEIEHIIPKSLLFDDSFANKTICHRNHNSGTNAKNQMTAYDFMKHRDGGRHFEEYTRLVTEAYNCKQISKTKWQRLLTPAENIPTGFIDRQLRETQYIAKKARDILQTVCHDVTATTGSVTDYLKHQWGWEKALLDLNWNRFPEELRKEEKDPNGNITRRIEGWTKRADQRHHALDALAVACTKPFYIEQLNKLHQKVNGNSGESRQSILKKETIQSERPFTPSQVREALANCLVSYKPGQRVATWHTNKLKKGKKTIHEKKELTPRGAFHEESVYGFRQTPDHGLTSVIRWKITDFDNTKQFNQVLDRRVRNLLIDKFIEAGGILERSSKKGKLPDEKDFTLNRFIEVGGPIVTEKLSREQETLNKKAFEVLKKTTFTLFDSTRKIEVPVRRVRVAVNYKLVPIHATSDGKTVPAAKLANTLEFKPVDYVNLKNNHHFALYRDSEGNIQERIVTFWEAFQRRKNGLPIVIKDPKSTIDNVIHKNTGYPESLWERLPQADWHYFIYGQQNEMFIFDLSREEIYNSINSKIHKTISPHLFRLKSVSKGDYIFSCHLDPTDGKNEKLERTIRIRSSREFIEREIHKVRLNHLGEIVSINDHQILE